MLLNIQLISWAFFCFISLSRTPATLAQGSTLPACVQSCLAQTANNVCATADLSQSCICTDAFANEIIPCMQEGCNADDESQGQMSLQSECGGSNDDNGNSNGKGNPNAQQHQIPPKGINAAVSGNKFASESLVLASSIVLALKVIM